MIIKSLHSTYLKTDFTCPAARMTSRADQSTFDQEPIAVGGSEFDHRGGVLGDRETVGGSNIKKAREEKEVNHDQTTSANKNLVVSVR